MQKNINISNNKISSKLIYQQTAILFICLVLIDITFLSLVLIYYILYIPFFIFHLCGSFVRVAYEWHSHCQLLIWHRQRNILPKLWFSEIISQRTKMIIPHNTRGAYVPLI